MRPANPKHAHARVRLVVLALASCAVLHPAPAHAGPSAFVTPPAGWISGVHDVKTAEVYIPPSSTKTNIELVVSHVATPSAGDGRAALVRAAIDDLHGMSRRAALTGSNVAEDHWEEASDPAARLAQATLAFRDPGAQLVETARIVIAGDATHVVAVTGECIARDDTPAELITTCKAALATLDPGVAPADRAPIAIAPAGTPAPDLPPPGAGSAIGPPPTTGGAATMSAGPHNPLPPITIPQDAPPGNDRRPVFVGAGIVLLAGVFWWNMRRRARHAREDQTDDDRESENR
jgi:hypothetical protein